MAKSRGRPVKNLTPTGLPVDEERASIVVKRDLWEKFKALAYWERKKQKTLLDLILRDYIQKYEKKNGEIKPMPPDAEI